MFRVGVSAQFEAAHRLRGDFGPATRLHGHTYRIEVSVQGPSLRQDGTLCDIGLLQQIVQEVVSPLHYQDLDDLDAFHGRNTTAEQVALYLFEAIGARLQNEGLATLAVQVWESPQAFAVCDGPLDTSSA